MKKNSIFIKTFFHLIILLFTMTLLVHISIYFIYNDMYIGKKSRELEAKIDFLCSNISKMEYSEIDDYLNNYAINTGVNIKFSSGDKISYYKGSGIFIDFFEENDGYMSIANLEGVESTITKFSNLALIDGRRAKIHIHEYLSSLNESRQVALGLLPYSLLISVIFALVFSYLFSKKLTKPIKSISREVSKMKNFDRLAYADISTYDEIGELANNVNIMYKTLLSTIDDYQLRTDQVLNIEKERMDFFRSASHELKTPLAKLSILIENMKYGVGKYKNHDLYLGESLDIISKMSDMIAGLLEGIKSLKTEGESEIICLNEAIKDTIQEYEIIAKSRRISLCVKEDGDFNLYIPKLELNKVLSNLMSNAVKYTYDGGNIVIAITKSKFSVYNDSDEISKDVLSKIWKGEYILPRLADKKIDSIPMKSSGLGMFIIKSILDNNKIEFDFLRKNDGYTFEIITNCELN